MSDKLYSPDIRERYEATIRGAKTLPKRWPMACGGAANAFLALIGPSMGGATPGEVAERGGANRPHRWLMKIGSDVQTFDWGDRRKHRWNYLCEQMLGNKDYIGALTALLNLD